MVTNGDRLTQKIADLTAAMGVEPNFSLKFADHFKAPETETPVQPEPPVEEPEKTLETWVIVLIVVASVALVGGAATATVIIIMKKRKVK